MLQSKKVNLTEGSITKSVFAFVIPVMIGTLLQNLFNIADKIVLGQMAGTEAVASVGACTVPVSLIVNFFVGFSGGVSVVLSRTFGEKDQEKARKIIGTALFSSVTFGILAAVLGVTTSNLFLHLTDCPESCFDGAMVYMIIYFCAAPLIVLYNFGAAILRSYGDSAHPTNYLVIGGVVNVLLNFLLCMLLEQKVAAVALATLASQAVSALLTFRRISRLEEGLRFDFRRLGFSKEAFLKILRYGFPNAVKSSLFSIANLQIQATVNSYGPAATAGQSAAQSIESVLNALEVGFSHAVLSMVGQNLGAEKPERVRKSFWVNLLYSTAITAVASIVIYSFRIPLLNLFVPGDTSAISFGVSRMKFVAAWYALNAAAVVLANTLNAFGYSTFVAISSFVATVVFRPMWMFFVYPVFMTFDCVMMCYIVSWWIQFILFVITLSVVFVRFKKGKYRRL